MMGPMKELKNQAPDDLAEAAEKRGYLLPHHGLMAVALPGMLEDYDRLYQSVATTPRHLDLLQREAIWLAVLAARDESLGTHHVARYRDAGGEDSDLGALLAIAALARGAGAFVFAGRHWQAHASGLEAESAWAGAVERAGQGLSPGLVHMAAVAALACVGANQALRWQLVAGLRAGVDECAMAEALSLMMLPGSVPNFARAAGLWRSLILGGEVPASSAFLQWARTPGQGGYDEAVGVAGAEPT